MESLLYKDYRPKTLTKYIEDEVNRLRITKRYKPIIVDILLRRIYEFDLSDEDIETDLKTLKEHLHKIEVVPPKNNTLGYYSPTNKKIAITRTTALNLDPEGMYTVLAHELFHTLLTTQNGSSRLSTINKYTNKENRFLEEAIVEEAADRLVQTKKRNTGRPTYLHKNVYGYTDITFVTDAIEAAYGVTEKDFLRNAIMGRKRLLEFLSTHSGEPIEETSSFLDYIEANFTTLHDTLYGVDKKSSKFQPESETKLDKEEKVISALSGIFIKCECKIKELIERSNVEDVVRRENWNNIKYNHNKLVIGMRRAVEDIELYRGLNIKELTLEAVKPYKDRTRRRINIVQAAIDLMKINGDDVPSETKAFEYELLTSAVKDDIDEVNPKNTTPQMMVLNRYAPKANRSVFSRLGVVVKDENLYRNSRVTKRYYEEEDFPRLRWNNSRICNQLKGLLEKDARVTLSEKFFRYIRNKYVDELAAPENKWLSDFIKKQMAERMLTYENEEKGLVEHKDKKGFFRSLYERFSQKKLLSGMEEIKGGLLNTNKNKAPISLSEGINFDDRVAVDDAVLKDIQKVHQDTQDNKTKNSGRIESESDKLDKDNEK